MFNARHSDAECNGWNLAEQMKCRASSSPTLLPHKAGGAGSQKIIDPQP